MRKKPCRSSLTEFETTSGDCVDFIRFANGTDLGAEFVSGWFHFKSVRTASNLPRVANHGPDEYGLTFDESGCQIKLLRTTKQVTLKGGSGISKDLIVTAFDRSKKEVARVSISGNAMPRLQQVTLRSPEIASLFVTNTGFENLISSICIGDVDIDQVLDDILHSERANNDAIRDNLDHPEAEVILEQARADLRDYYASRTLPPPPHQGGGSGGTSEGINLNPDWECVAITLVLVVAVAAALTIAANAAGVATIGALAAESATAALTSFGLSQGASIAIWQGIAVTGVLATTLDKCGAFE